MKLARKYAKEKMGEDRYEIITHGAVFHGRTWHSDSNGPGRSFIKGMNL